MTEFYSSPVGKECSIHFSRSPHNPWHYWRCSCIDYAKLDCSLSKKEGVARFKKLLSTLNQAAQSTVADFGYTPECYTWEKSPYPGMFNCIKYNDIGACTAWGDAEGNPRPADYSGRFGECSAYYDVFYSKLKVVKVCEKNAYENGCSAAYKGKDTFYKESDDTLTENDLLVKTASDPTMREANLKAAKAVVLADGSVIIHSHSWNSVIDVNGLRGPNKWGYDVFRITRRGAPERGIKYTYDDNMPLETGGKKTSDMFLQ